MVAEYLLGFVEAIFLNQHDAPDAVGAQPLGIRLVEVLCSVDDVRSEAVLERANNDPVEVPTRVTDSVAFFLPNRPPKILTQPKPR